MGEEGGERSEEPTPHRLREAREKGQVAKSKEITTAILLLLTYYLFRYTGEFMWKELVGMCTTLFDLIPSFANEFSLSIVGYAFLVSARGFAFAVGPIFAVGFFAALIAEAIQTGFVFSFDPLSPKIEKLNPMEGFKKIFSMQGLVETIKSIVKILIVFYITWMAIKEDLPFLVMLINSQPWDALVLGGSIAYKVAMRVGLFYIAIAILDYFYRRFEYMKNLRMTKQEIKEEYKRLEGDPLIKQRIRELQRQMAQQRMMASVPKADVVVTNPTHLAVALQYIQGKSRAPKVLAKGQRLHAEEIKKIAEEHNVPIIENKPLAQSIYHTTAVGQEIPRELYKAAAEILAYVYKLKKSKKRVAA
ncbi:MAG: flagellar biosynthetic protein FlhB [Candidatus Saganbacteria bacterium]|uniref:Flagellar biosynthetic protein FlhB n=1 Tax=Candidatus Saganbacteria bacterium TaxID=2575572 RepID=A0A833L2W5_UNCSA|nr:MAG: flagellar biosynthetic protein FlhB [Candidatus Saganbacteria bacterium]